MASLGQWGLQDCQEQWASRVLREQPVKREQLAQWVLSVKQVQRVQREQPALLVPPVQRVLLVRLDLPAQLAAFLLETPAPTT